MTQQSRTWAYIQRIYICIFFEFLHSKNTHTPMFIATLFTIDKTWKQPKCPLTDE